MEEKDSVYSHSECSRVADFYQGKSIFLTGASGFVGSVLLECLLRCCPGIQTIYILLRSKRGKDVQERNQKILEKSIFDHLKRENPLALSKIRIVPGDISQPKFGMSDEDYDTIAQQVSIVFHCAACIALDKPLDFILRRNTMSVDNAIELCRKIKKLDALVYTSSAFSNSNRTFIKECIYRLPFPAKTFIDALNNSKEELLSLFEECHPRWPNTYTFSKCVAENILVEKAADIPFAIVRPSIIVCSLKGPLPGYVEDSSGITNLSVATGKGFAKVIWTHPQTELNTVLVDAVANAHVLCAWIAGTGRRSSPFIVNCAKSGYVESISQFCRTMLTVGEGKPLPNSFSRQTKFLLLTENLLLYKLAAFFQHYIPAYIIDAILRFKGKNPKLIPLYKLYDDIQASLFEVTRRTLKFDCDTYEGMPRLLHPEDKEIFNTNVKDFTFQDLVKVLRTGAPFLDPKIDKRTKEDREKIVNQRFWIMRIIKTTAILFFIATLYLAFILVNRILQTFSTE